MIDAAQAAKELREARAATGQPQEHVARAIGISLKSLQRYEKHGLTNPAKFDRLMRYYRAQAARVRQSQVNEVPRGTYAVGNQSDRNESEPLPVVPLGTLPREFAALASGFQTEMINRGVDADFFRWAMRLLTQPELFQMYSSGYRAMTEAQQLEDYRDTIDELRERLDDRVPPQKDGAQ